MPTAPSLLIADRYRLAQPLGQGGMGRVWKARDEMLNRDVAIKELVPPPGLTEPERAELRQRSMREARAIAQLNHPNVVRIYDLVRIDEGDPWIVMQYLPGGSLQNRLAVNGPLTVPEVTRIAAELLAALQAAHALGVVHRDIKPDNVLIDEDGKAVLTDFGIATIPGDPFVTRTGVLFGSPAYLAPERVRGAKADAASDLWSLGATLYAAVEGKAPFARGSTMETLSALATEPLPEPRRAGPLTPVLKGLLQKDPAARLTGPQAQRMLTKTVPTQRVNRTQALPTQPIPSMTPRKRRKGIPRSMWLVVLGLVAVLVVAFLWSNKESPEQPSAKPSISSPAAEPSGFPAGWQMRDDGTGFRVPVPSGWTFGRDDDGRALWRDPSGRLLLLIDQTRKPKADPLKDWRNQESARRKGYRDYQRIRLEEVSYWDRAADWEFTYTSRNGNPLHVLNRGFITAPDQAYSIYWATPADEWDDHRDELQIIFGGFQPARS